VFRLITGLALAVVFLACLIASAPARLLNSFLPADRVILQGFSGTLWNGSASRALVGAGSGYIHLGAVSWSLNPLSLLTLSPGLRVESSWGKQQLSTDIRFTGSDSIELANLDALVSAQLLKQFLPLAVGGDFSVQLGDLVLQGGLPIRGEGRIVWQQATWESAQGVLPLGSYAVDFQQLPGQALSGEIVTIAGAVTAQGNVSLEGIHYSVDLLVTSEPGLDGQLQQALSLIAQPVSEGYRIAFDGQLLEIE